MEPKAYIDGWHIRMICRHLEAVTHGHIRRLIINVPPRHMKSLAVSVFWPAWEWLSDPGVRWLTSSYAQNLSIRDSVKCRRLVQSPWYQKLIRTLHPSWSLAGDMNNKTRWESNLSGVRLASSVEGALTGEGGDKIVVDDPHNIIEGESATQRQAVLEWWDYSMSTRLNDPRTGAYVVIMQRVHEDDLTGHLLSTSVRQRWNHLCLPARYEGKKDISTVLNEQDPRTVLGEPLWPEQYGDEQLRDLEESLGSYGSAGQLQQRPAPREGGMFKVRRLIENRIDHVSPDQVMRSVRYWDKAGTAGAGCYSAGVLVHELKDRTYLIADVVAGQWGALEREQRIQSTALLDGRKVRVWVEQEPGSGGKESAESTIRNLRGFVAKADRVTGSKESRAEPLAAQVEAGNVFVLDREWTKDLIDEMEMFPNGKFKDRVDACVGAFNQLFHKRISPHVGSAPRKEELERNVMESEFADLLAQAETEEERAEIRQVIQEAMR